MTVSDLLSNDVPPLHTTDTVEHALGLLLELHLEHLPVVDGDGDLAGVVSEERLLNADDADTELRRLLTFAPVSAQPHHHVFEVAKLLVQHDLSSLPVTDDEGAYLGLVERSSLLEEFAQMLMTQEPGAILTLEVEPHNHALSQLAYAVEQHDAKVLSVVAEPTTLPDGLQRVTVKLNVTETARIRHVLEHEGYRIVSSFNEAERDSDLQDRVDAFMRYLEV